MEEPETDAVSAAVERVLSAHLAKQQDVLLERLDSRMEALERQVAEENAKTIKLVTARFNEVTGLVQGSKASASPVAVQTSSTSSGSEADLQAIPSKITHVSFFSLLLVPLSHLCLLPQLDDRLTMVFTSLKRVESKLEQNQAKLSAIENKAVTEVNYTVLQLYCISLYTIDTFRFTPQFIILLSKYLIIFVMFGWCSGHHVTFYSQGNFM